MNTDIETKVRKIIIAQLYIQPEHATDDAKFIEDLGADSLDAVELIMTFEEEFDMEIPDEHYEGMKTIGDAIAYIKKAVSERT